MNPCPSDRGSHAGSVIAAVFALTLLVSGAVVAAQTDLSSPRSTLKSLYEAVERGDEEAIRQAFFAENRAQRESNDAYATLVVAGKRLADAARKRYGDSADALAQGAVPAAEIDKLEAATVKEEGDTATLLMPLSDTPIIFRRAEPGWQIVLDSAATAKLAGQIEMTREMATAFTELAIDIAAGKYPAVGDAEMAIQQRTNEVTSRFVHERPPTTRPATAPATSQS